MVRDELITYDSLIATFKTANMPFQAGWCEGTQSYLVALKGLGDVFIFEFEEDGSFKSIDRQGCFIEEVK